MPICCGGRYKQWILDFLLGDVRYYYVHWYIVVWLIVADVISLRND